ncbi:MAG: imidazolonepropionase [Bacteroidia bacterium]
MDFLLKNIQELIGITNTSNAPKKGAEMKEVHRLENAYLLVHDGKIMDFGPMDDCPTFDGETHDLSNRVVLPAFIDSHTHLVFADSRAGEFKMRLEGKSYQEIAEAGGGILNSAAKLAEMNEEELYERAMIRLQQAIKGGTAALEIKSGYGLSTDAELKMLRVIKKLKANASIPIKATFLGAHALPTEFKDNKQGYINLVCNEMLPIISREGLADYIDIFCEEGYFDLIDLQRIIEAGQNYGLRAKVHVNQFKSFGAVPLACKLGALSVDHLEVMNDQDIKALRKSNTIAVGLPLCSLFLDIPYAPARKMIDEGIAFAMASDYNPGSSPSMNLMQAFSLACTQMKLTPEEAFNALTYNAAFSMQIEQEMGSIQLGKKANLIISNQKAKGLEDFPYWFGENLIEQVVLA